MQEILGITFADFQKDEKVWQKIAQKSSVLFEKSVSNSFVQQLLAEYESQNGA